MAHSRLDLVLGKALGRALVLWRFDESVLRPDQLPDWSFLLRLASPTESYNRPVTALFDSEFGVLYTIPQAPWYVDEPVAVVVLLAWVVVPVTIGYLGFRRLDL